MAKKRSGPTTGPPPAAPSGTGSAAKSGRQQDYRRQDIEPKNANLEATFHKLVARWKRESALMSSPVEMAALPSYLSLVALGSAAIPLLLQELAHDPDHFCALSLLTGEHPIPAQDAGDITKMAAAWLQWVRPAG